MQQTAQPDLRKVFADAGNTPFTDQVRLLESSELDERRRAAEQAVGSVYADAGLDVDQLRSVREDHRRELDHVAQAQLEEAVASSAAARETLDARFAVRKGLIGTGKAPEPDGIGPKRQSFLLLEPFLIQPSPEGVLLTGEQISSGSSSAHTKVTARKTGEAQVSFYYQWENPHDHHVTIDVSTALGLIGSARVHAEGGLFSRTYSRLRIFSALAVRWPEPKPYLLADLQDVVIVDATSTSWLDGDTRATFDKVQDLTSTTLGAWIEVEPRELVVFEVAVVAAFHIEGDGYATVDLASGSFGLYSPWVGGGVWHV